MTPTIASVPRGSDRHEQFLASTREHFNGLLKQGTDDLPGLGVALDIKVEAMAAAYMIPFRSLIDAFIACSDPQGMAEFLGVDTGLIYARMLGLSSLERTMLNVCGSRCIGVDLSAPHPDGRLRP